MLTIGMCAVYFTGKVFATKSSVLPIHESFLPRKFPALQARVVIHTGVPWEYVLIYKQSYWLGAYVYYTC